MITRRNWIARSIVGGPFLADSLRGENSEGLSPAIPFRTIYSNDTTHILSCKMPWRDRKDPLTDEHIAMSIREAAGVDAHFLQPGLGWIPWWKSEIYSPQEHYDEFLQKEQGHQSINKIGRYLLEGGDMLQTLVTTCREIGVAPFLSFRLNDGHHVRELKEALETGKPSSGMSRFYWENYERFRIGPDLSNWDEGVFDWAIPEVREHKFQLLEEACANYDLAGLELDFLRHWVRFGEATPPGERAVITTEFVKRVREMLDRTAAQRGLPRRWLCVRVPAKANVRPEQGIDLYSLAKAGVDLVNLSYSYFTHQDDSIRLAVEELGNERVAVYAEMTHCTLTGKATAGSGTQPFLRTTDEQFYTTAHLAYEQGASGVSLFNFPYYRYHVTDAIGPFHEPPFSVLPKLHDREFLRQQSRWFFLSACRRDRVLGERALPVLIQRNEPVSVSMTMTALGDDYRDGLLRLRSDEKIDDREIEVRFNGERLESAPFTALPLPHLYGQTWIGTEKEHACFSIPFTLVRDGSNTVEILVTGGIRVRVNFVEAVFERKNNAKV
ncbi:MAG: hypothetical protein P1U87_01670 [Verrucomicrobiales bacterium]|nr:hypothetical protein [Verrucomicrobiales bacterium]